MSVCAVAPHVRCKAKRMQRGAGNYTFGGCRRWAGPLASNRQADAILKERYPTDALTAFLFGSMTYAFGKR